MSKTLFKEDEVVTIQVPARVFSNLWAGGSNTSMGTFTTEDLRRNVVEFHLALSEMAQICFGGEMSVADDEIERAWYFLNEHLRSAMLVLDAMEGRPLLASQSEGMIDS